MHVSSLLSDGMKKEEAKTMSAENTWSFRFFAGYNSVRKRLTTKLGAGSSSSKSKEISVSAWSAWGQGQSQFNSGSRRTNGVTVR